ncbi:MAG: ATP-binding protein [Desulfobacterales bacterium]
MFLKNTLRIARRLAFRLTLWYGGIFAASLCLAFVLFYLFISSALENQTDEDLLRRSRELESLFFINGIEAVKQIVVLEAQAAGEKKIFVRLLYSDGAAFLSSNMSDWKDIPIHSKAVDQLTRGADAVFHTVSIPHRKNDVRILYSVLSRGIFLQLGQSLELQTRFFNAFRSIFIITTSILVLLSALIGGFMARRATAGVDAVTKTARQIADGAIHRRVPVNKRGDEIAQLALTFNQMLDRIQDLVKNIEEISDNIAHDLKSPVTRIRGVAEVTLTTGESLPEFEAMAAGIIEECDRLLDMINTMLVISKTESGVEAVSHNTVDLSAVVEDGCGLFGPTAEDKGIVLVCRLEPYCRISGDIKMIQRMVANLIDNAVKYTPAEGTVTLSLRRGPSDFVTLSISDTGQGISADDIPKIFNRFYRGDPSRSEGGTGLGLSLARAVARAHGGDITVDSTPGAGSTFTVALPREGAKRSGSAGGLLPVKQPSGSDITKR